MLSMWASSGVEYYPLISYSDRTQNKRGARKPKSSSSRNSSIFTPECSKFSLRSTRREVLLVILYRLIETGLPRGWKGKFIEYQLVLTNSPKLCSGWCRFSFFIQRTSCAEDKSAGWGAGGLGGSGKIRYLYGPSECCEAFILKGQITSTFVGYVMKDCLLSLWKGPKVHGHKKFKSSSNIKYTLEVWEEKLRTLKHFWLVLYSQICA